MATLRIAIVVAPKIHSLQLGRAADPRAAPKDTVTAARAEPDQALGLRVAVGARSSPWPGF